MYTDEPIRDFEAWDAEQEERLAERPLCEYCEEPIQGNIAYRIGGELICEDCMEQFRVYI